MSSITTTTTENGPFDQKASDEKVKSRIQAISTEDLVKEIEKRRNDDKTEAIGFSLQIRNWVLEPSVLKEIVKKLFETAVANGWEFPEKVADNADFVLNVVKAVLPLHLEYLEKVGDNALEGFLTKKILGIEYNCDQILKQTGHGETIKSANGVLEGMNVLQQARSNEMLKKVAEANGLATFIDEVKTIVSDAGVKITTNTKYYSDVVEALIGVVSCYMRDQSDVFESWMVPFVWNPLKKNWDEITLKRWKSQLNELLQIIQKNYCEANNVGGKTNAINHVKDLVVYPTQFERGGSKNFLRLWCVVNPNLMENLKYPLVAPADAKIKFIMQRTTDLCINSNRKDRGKSNVNQYVKKFAGETFPVEIRGQSNWQIGDMLDLKKNDDPDRIPYELNYGVLSGTVTHGPNIAVVEDRKGDSVKIPIVPGMRYIPNINPETKKYYGPDDVIREGDVFGFVIPPIHPETKIPCLTRAKGCGRSRAEAEEDAALAMMALFGNQISKKAHVNFDVKIAKNKHDQKVAFAKAKAEAAAQKLALKNGSSNWESSQKKRKFNGHSGNGKRGGRGGRGRGGGRGGKPRYNDRRDDRRGGYNDRNDRGYNDRRGGGRRNNQPAWMNDNRTP